MSLEEKLDKLQKQNPAWNLTLIKRTITELLKLKKDWDGYEAEPFKPETFIRAINYLPKMLEYVKEKIGILIDKEPLILPCNNSSIDLRWQTPQYFLLLNVPYKERADYYGKFQQTEITGAYYNNGKHKEE